MQTGNATVVICFVASAGDEIRALQTDFIAGKEAKIFFDRLCHEVVLLHIELAGEGHLAGAELRPVGIILHFDRFRLPFRVIVDDDLQRAENRHCARRIRIEPVTHTGLEQAVIHDAVSFGDTDAFTEIADGGSGIAATAHAAQRGHTGVIPAADEAVFYERKALALAGDAVIEIEPCKFDLARRMLEAQLLQEPIVKRAVVFKFKRA